MTPGHWIVGSKNHWLDALKDNAPVRTTLRIRLPNDYKVTDGPSLVVPDPVTLRRYDALTDELVAVTQEWVDLATTRMRDMHLELVEARKRAAQLTTPTPAIEPESTSTIDHMWRMVQASCGK